MRSAGARAPRSRVQTTTTAATTVGSLGVVLAFVQHHPRHETEHAQAEHEVDGSKRDIEPTVHGVIVGLLGSEVKSKQQKKVWGAVSEQRWLQEASCAPCCASGPDSHFRNPAYPIAMDKDDNALDMDYDDKRRILGDAIILCGRCGFAKRYMELEGPPDLPHCPDCGDPMIHDCPACHAPMRSIMQVECRVCGEPLRAPEAFGVPIRRKAEPSDRGPVQLD